MNNVSKVKIAVGYTLLLAVLFFSLFFVHREMENLILTDDRIGIHLLNTGRSPAGFT